MTAKVEDAYHLHLPCTRDRSASFEIDFSGVFFYFTVGTSRQPVWTLHAKSHTLELSLFETKPMSSVLARGQPSGGRALIG